MIKFDIDKKVRFKKVEEIFELPKTIVVNHFDEPSAKSFRTDFADALKTGQEIIPVIIDSYGGMVDSLLAMADVIKRSPVPVATVVSGKAMSCGSILFSCGTEGHRYVGDFGRVLVHPVTSGVWGHHEDIKAKAKETKRLNKLILQMMATNCGQKKNFFISKLEENVNTDWILTPQDCVAVNLAQHIGTPMFNISMNVKVEFKV